MPYEFFPQEVIALQRELVNHPALIELLTELESDDWIDRLACVAAYCEVILDGVYSETDVLILCDTLTQRLKDKRALVILTDEPRTLTVVPSLDAPHKDDPAAEGTGAKIILH